MIKFLRNMIAWSVFISGIILAFYVGGWLLIIKPIIAILTAIKYGTISIGLIIISLLEFGVSITAGIFIFIIFACIFNIIKG